jgi:hypothetical protein
MDSAAGQFTEVDSGPHLESARGVRTRQLPAPGVVHALSLVAAAVILIRADVGRWFYSDEWDFVLQRGLHSPQFGLFVPHNEHWSTIPILIYRAIFSVVGIRHYWPYEVPLLVAHLLLAHVLWRVMRRSGSDVWIATALAAVFAVLGAGAEDLLWAFQIGFVGAVLAGYVELLLVDHDGCFGRRDVLGWLAGVAALMFSGMGVPMTVAAVVCVWLRRGLRQAVLTAVVPATVFLIWFMAVGHVGFSSDRDSESSISRMVHYAYVGLTTALGQASGISWAGGALAALLLAFLVWYGLRSGVKGRVAPVYASTAGALAMLAIDAYGRARFGVDEAKSSRYVYILIALLLPVIGLALSRLLHRGRLAAVAAVPLAVALLIPNVSDLYSSAAAARVRLTSLKIRILAAAVVAGHDRWLTTQEPDPTFSPNVNMVELRRLFDEGALPHPLAVPATAILQIETQLEFHWVRIGKPVASQDVRLEAASPMAVTSVGEGCVLATSTAGPETLRFSSASTSEVLAVRPEAATLLWGRLISGGFAGPERLAAVAGGTTFELSVQTADATFEVGLHGGTRTEICGLHLGP